MGAYWRTADADAKEADTGAVGAAVAAFRGEEPAGAL
jgi:hypothetical protein